VWSLLLSLVGLLAPRVAEAKKAPSLPVMQFDAQNGADPKLAILANDAASESLRDLNVFKVISSEDIKRILSFQRDKALASGGSCNEDQCLAEIGGALGADYMVSGKLTRIDKQLKLELQLFNNAKAKVENAVSQENLTDERSLVEAAKLLARRVVAPLLDKHAGQLFLTVSDQGADGATIDIDGKVVGTTVPPGIQAPPVPLGWGPHHVIVKKEGFLSYEKDVQIDEGQATTLVVTLVPSPDFIDAYKGRNARLRYGAYGAGVVAVALGVLAVFENSQNIALYKLHTNALEEVQGKPYTNTNVGGCQVLESKEHISNGDCSAALTASASAGSQQITRIWVEAGGAVAVAVTGSVLYLLSDDPHRYDGFLQANPPPSTETAPAVSPAHASSTRQWVPEVGFAPLDHGAYATVALTF
jgi:TolB-like protein